MIEFAALFTIEGSLQVKHRVLLGLGISALCIVSADAGTMAATRTYPAGFVIGGDVGYGYLNTQERDLADSLGPFAIASGNVLTQHHELGHFIGGAHAGYDFPVLERLLAGFEMGYKNT